MWQHGTIPAVRDGQTAHPSLPRPPPGLPPADTRCRTDRRPGHLLASGEGIPEQMQVFTAVLAVLVSAAEIDGLQRSGLTKSGFKSGFFVVMV